MSLQYSPDVDRYIEKLDPPFNEILNHVRSIAHDSCSNLEETIKWSMPCLSYKGIVAQLAGFKHHARLAFWKGSLLDSPHLNLMGTSREMGTIQIKERADVPSDAILVDLFKRAVDLNERGIKIKRTKRPRSTAPDPPEWFLEALRQKKEAMLFFNSLSPSQQKEYVEWLVDAKRDATRLRRLDQALEWLSEGKLRNWKYMNC